MDLENLKKLIDLMNTNELLELEVVEEGTKIRLKKMYDGGTRIVQMPMAAGSPQMMSAPASGGAAAPAAPAPRSAPSGRVFIKSPMVGTFYRSPDPESPAYINVGDMVGADTPVCILEAMKVFNEIKAECEGRVAEVLVETGEAVEYGQPLFAVDPM